MGICGGAQEYHDEPAAAVLIGAFPENAFRVFPVVRGDLGDLPAAVRGWADETDAPFGVVHGDPYNHRLPEILDEMAGGLSSFLVGGLTCSRTQQHQLAGDLGAGGVSGVLFAPDVPVTVGLTQGCSPLGPSHEITAGEGNVIVEIDGRPALDVFKEDIGEMLAHDLQRVAGYVHVAFPVSGADGEADYLVRNLVAIDADNDLLAVATEVVPGDRVMFVRRDPQSAQKDLQRMLDDVKKRMPGKARGAVYVSCVARGPSMFGSESAEAQQVSAGLGDVPVIGFYAGGEISNDRLYGYTGVLLVFG